MAFILVCKFAPGMFCIFTFSLLGLFLIFPCLLSKLLAIGGQCWCLGIFLGGFCFLFEPVGVPVGPLLRLRMTDLHLG